MTIKTRVRSTSPTLVRNTPVQYKWHRPPEEIVLTRTKNDKFPYIVKTFCSLSQLSKQYDSRREFLFLRYSHFPFPFTVKGSCSGDRTGYSLFTNPYTSKRGIPPWFTVCIILPDEIERCDWYFVPRILGCLRLALFYGIILSFIYFRYISVLSRVNQHTKTHRDVFNPYKETRGAKIFIKLNMPAQNSEAAAGRLPCSNGRWRCLIKRYLFKLDGGLQLHHPEDRASRWTVRQLAWMFQICKRRPGRLHHPEEGLQLQHSEDRASRWTMRQLALMFQICKRRPGRLHHPEEGLQLQHSEERASRCTMRQLAFMFQMCKRTAAQLAWMA